MYTNHVQRTSFTDINFRIFIKLMKGLNNLFFTNTIDVDLIDDEQRSAKKIVKNIGRKCIYFINKKQITCLHFI